MCLEKSARNLIAELTELGYNLTGKVYSKEQKFCGSIYSDIYVGILNDTKVAVKAPRFGDDIDKDKFIRASSIDLWSATNWCLSYPYLPPRNQCESCACGSLWIIQTFFHWGVSYWSHRVASFLGLWQIGWIAEHWRSTMRRTRTEWISLHWFVIIPRNLALCI